MKLIFDTKIWDKPANKKIMNYGIPYEITVDIPIIICCEHVIQKSA